MSPFCLYFRFFPPPCRFRKSSIISLVAYFYYCFPYYCIVITDRSVFRAISYYCYSFFVPFLPDVLIFDGQGADLRILSRPGWWDEARGSRDMDHVGSFRGTTVPMWHMSWKPGGHVINHWSNQWFNTCPFAGLIVFMRDGSLEEAPECIPRMHDRLIKGCTGGRHPPV